MRRYSIERRDTDYEEEMIYLEQEFWEECVQKKLPPPYTESGDLIIASSRRHSGPPIWMHRFALWELE